MMEVQVSADFGGDELVLPTCGIAGSLLEWATAYEHKPEHSS
jgi:hypothetical protein